MIRSTSFETCSLRSTMMPITSMTMLFTAALINAVTSSEKPMDSTSGIARGSQAMPMAKRPSIIASTTKCLLLKRLTFSLLFRNNSRMMK